MRPFSLYLDTVKNPTAESAPARFDLASSTPPIPKDLPKFLKFEPIESRRATVTAKVLARISKLSGASPDRLLLTVGSSSGFFQALAAVTSPGDTIVIETPTYEPFISVARFLKLKIRRFRRTGDFDRDLKNLKGLGKANVLVLSNPNCPTGWLYSKSEISRLKAFFTTVIVDEIFLPVFTGEITRTDGDPKFISLSGLSKTLGLSSLRVGWINASEKILRECDRIGLNTHCDVPTPSLSVAHEVLSAWPRILKAHRALVEANRPVLQTFAKRHPDILSHDFSIGHFGSLKVPKKFGSATEFARALRHRTPRDASIAVSACEPFGLKKEIRISLWLPSRDFKTAFEAIEAFY